MTTYEDFLRAKIVVAPRSGFDIDPSEIHPRALPHQRLAIQWAVKGGRRALFESFGLGKTLQQIECVRLTLSRAGGRGLIVAPLGVRQEFLKEAETIGVPMRFVKRIEECAPDGVHITNYETVRDGKLDPRHFTVSSLDEAAILRGFGGSKTFREFMKLFAGDDRSGVKTEGVPYRFVATATPSPNEFIELLAYAAYLDIMDVSQAKTRFFKRDSTKADVLTIHPHKEQEFWLWVSSWALFVQRPSDLGCSDDGYDLPPLVVNWHELASDHTNAGSFKDGQMRMFKDAGLGIVEASAEKRESCEARVLKMKDIVDASPADHFLLWHDLEAERHEIKRVIPDAIEAFGSQDLEEREDRIRSFSDGEIRLLATKPVIAGSGCNFQRFCHRAIFLGIGFKFADFIQAIHRIQRFLQKEPVIIDIIYTEAEREIRRSLERKWEDHKVLVGNMSAIIKEHGLNAIDMNAILGRALGVKRQVVQGERFTAIHNDSVLETSQMPENSVGLILTSIPFSTQYEYSPNFADFGHTNSNEHFWQQMDFLTPNLHRILQPGRLAIIHVKDRIIPSGLTGLGYQTVYPFHAHAIEHYTKHGFGYVGMTTIVTDVVRENNQTYRLGWTKQCKDASGMGVGMPEYLLMFRRRQSSTENGFADVPVVKSKDRYTRGRWQIDAAGFKRSDGNRQLTPEELIGLKYDGCFQAFRRHYLQNVYNFEAHVALNEALDAKNMLPTTFQLLQLPSWAQDVWTDVTRMLTHNTMQGQKGKEQHLCPMPLDIADRCIVQWTNEDDVVLDPFAGLMTVPARAIKFGRKGIGIELSASYFADGLTYLEAAERDFLSPDLFSAIEAEEEVVTAETNEP